MQEPDLDLDVTWLPFELHPDTPEAGMPLTQYFGTSPERLEPMLRGLRERAEPLGLPFNPPQNLVNTRKALLLAEHARDEGKLDVLHPRLFRAYFAEGRNLADEGELRELARDAGLDPDRALEAVRERRHVERLSGAMELARLYGISGAPTFIINERYKIVGAQPYEALRDAFWQIAREGP